MRIDSYTSAVQGSVIMKNMNIPALPAPLDAIVCSFPDALFAAIEHFNIRENR
jgi:hypothetical protein